MNYHAIRLDLGSRDENRLVASVIPDFFEYIPEKNAYFKRGVYSRAKLLVDEQMIVLMMAT